MKKYILILAVLLAGCDSQRGQDVVCGPRGELYTTNSKYYAEATPLYNKEQVCINQPDGSILIKSKTAIENED